MLKTKVAETDTAAPTLKRFLRRKQVRDVTGLPDSSIYALVAQGKFPKPFPLSQNRVAWLEDEIAAWQADRLRQREAA